MPSTFAWWGTALAVAALPPFTHAQQPERPVERQIADAVSPLPDSLRPGAQVLGYRDGRLVELRGELEEGRPHLALALPLQQNTL